MRQQRTLRHVIGCAGVGLHRGARVAVTLRPAAEGSGIRFRRVDRPGSSAIEAHPYNAFGADGVTSLANGTGGSIRMVEHLMAALAACQIDNLLIEVSGPELPAMDGSARPFVLLMECAGTVEQEEAVARLEILRPVEVRSPLGHARLEPASDLELVVDAADGSRPPAFAMTFSPEACKGEVVGARDKSCIDRRRDDTAHRPGEAARHAALDALGGLALVPAWICGRYIERNADAGLRCALLRALLADRRNFDLTGLMLEALAWRPQGSLARAS